jgi:hypothetical protein
MSKDKYQPTFGEPVSDWVKSFAWLPKDTIDYGLVWLVKVYKRRCQPHDYLSGPQTPWFQYLKGKP